MQDSFLVKGMAFKKDISYASFEQQPKNFKNPKLLFFNLEIVLKPKKKNVEVRYVDFQLSYFTLLVILLLYFVQAM